MGQELRAQRLSLNLKSEVKKQGRTGEQTQTQAQYHSTQLDSNQLVSRLGSARLLAVQFSTAQIFSSFTSLNSSSIRLSSAELVKTGLLGGSEKRLRSAVSAAQLSSAQLF